MKEQDNFDKNIKTLMATMNPDIEGETFHKKYFYIMNPAPVFDDKAHKLKIGFYVYNKKTEKCTSVLYNDLIDFTKSNVKEVIKNIKTKLQKKIKKEKI